MLVHCTEKLAAKLPDVSREPLEETSPLGSWTAHLVYFQRQPCVIFCHDKTHYGLFLPRVRKAQFAELGRLHRELFLATLRFYRVSEEKLRTIEGALGTTRFDRATHRLMVAAIRQLDEHELFGAVMWHAPHLVDLDPVMNSVRITYRRITLNGKSICPKQEMLALIDTL